MESDPIYFSADARLASAGGDFEDCLFAQTSFFLARPIRSIEKGHGRDVCFAHEKASEKSVTAEIRRKAPKEHRRTQGWLRQVAMPGKASGDARLPSAGGDFEDCLFAQTSFCLARPIRSIEENHGRDVRSAHEKTRSENRD